MFDFIFETNSNWSWETFLLYYFVSVVVVSLCKYGIGTSFTVTNASHTLIYKQKVNYLPFFLAYLILVILATIRSDTVGTDTSGYVEQFRYIDKTPIDVFDWKELFFFLLNKRNSRKIWEYS